jgi:hypothetical protein
MSVEKSDLRGKLQALWLLKTRRSGLEQEREDINSQIADVSVDIARISHEVGVTADSKGWACDLLQVSDQLLAQVELINGDFDVRFFHVHKIYETAGVQVENGSSPISEPEQMPSGVASQ